VTSGGGKRHRTRLVHTVGKKPLEVRNEINVTPLVDVCLVLLIIFMVVLPKMSRGKEVDLPKTKHHKEKRDNGDQPIVSIAKDGARTQIFYNADAMPDVAALKTTISKDMQRKGGRVFVKADSNLTFGQVYPVLIAIHEAGSLGVELGTSEEK
jgi:biopolymer transport protein TolR